MAVSRSGMNHTPTASAAAAAGADAVTPSTGIRAGMVSRVVALTPREQLADGGDCGAPHQPCSEQTATDGDSPGLLTHRHRAAEPPPPPPVTSAQTFTAAASARALLARTFNTCARRGAGGTAASSAGPLRQLLAPRPPVLCRN